MLQLGGMFRVIACWKISDLLQTATDFLLGMPGFWFPSTLAVSQPLLRMKNISAALCQHHRGSLWCSCSETFRSLPYIRTCVSTKDFYFTFMSRELFPHIFCHQLEFHTLFSRGAFSFIALPEDPPLGSIQAVLGLETVFPSLNGGGQSRYSALL